MRSNITLGSGDAGHRALEACSLVTRALKTTLSGTSHSVVLPKGIWIIFTPAGLYEEPSAKTVLAFLASTKDPLGSNP